MINPFYEADAAIEHGPTLARILALPRRAPMAPEEVEAFSRALRLRDFDDTGRPVRFFAAQAEALRECYQVGGLAAPMRCGSGKTLVSFTLPVLLGSRNPVLIAPANLIRDKPGEPSKTKREFAAYRRDWNARLPRLVSYEELGREDRDGYLESLAPDLIILDEAHVYRTHKRNARAAAMAKRIARARNMEPRPIFVCMSGTLITDRLLDYAPALADCLGLWSPAPTDIAEAGRWGQALDRDVGGLNRIHPGALVQVPGGFHSWLRGSRGVVCTPGKDCDASIEISTWRPTLPERLKKIIADVTETEMRPDGEMLEELEVSTCLSALALGFFPVWDPLPPEWWLLPRRAYLAASREILDQDREGLDSEGQVRNALLSGRYRDTDALQKLEAWLAVRDRFEPNPVPIWITNDVMEQAANRVRQTDTIVWTRFRAPGHALQKLGVTYYGGGTNPERHRTTEPIACSISAHGTGKNLQARSSNLVLTPMAKESRWEQLLARTHRTGQLADTVRVSVIQAIDYHAEVMARVRDEARAVSFAAGENRKLVDATRVDA